MAIAITACSLEELYERTNDAFIKTVPWSKDAGHELPPTQSEAVLLTGGKKNIATRTLVGYEGKKGLGGKRRLFVAVARPMAPYGHLCGQDSLQAKT